MQLTRAAFVHADVLSFVLLAVLAWALEADLSFYESDSQLSVLVMPDVSCG